MTNKKTIEEFRLITIYGDEIIIETDEDSFEEVHEKILENLESNQLYFVGDYCETARYKGYFLTVIDMKKIIGKD